ncbi:hypothetical protein TPA0908_55530 [Micromonospora sp. AKA38]|nr:hypothetical protein TPA0908_55530 [Micromonospora sp. AKA38]
MLSPAIDAADRNHAFLGGRVAHAGSFRVISDPGNDYDICGQGIVNCLHQLLARYACAGDANNVDMPCDGVIYCFGERVGISVVI